MISLPEFWPTDNFHLKRAIISEQPDKKYSRYKSAVFTEYNSGYQVAEYHIRLLHIGTFVWRINEHLQQHTWKDDMTFTIWW